MTSWRRVLVDSDFLSLFKAMDSRGDDARSSLETADHTEAAFVLGKIDLVQRNRAGGEIDDPNEVLAILGEDGGPRHSQHCWLLICKPRRDGASKPEAWRWIA